MNERSPVRSPQPWIILGIVVAVIAGGFIALPRDEQGKARLLNLLGTSNRGILLRPMVPVAELELRTPDDESLEWAAMKPKWRLLIPVVLPCAEACRSALYLSRQVHVRLEKDALRMERVLLVLGAPPDRETTDWLQREHPHLSLMRGDSAAFTHWPAASAAAWNPSASPVFVVDPAGMAMLYFTSEHSGADMLADLRHLLKYSSEN
ncbi:MAG: hypothetical protein AB7I68_07650 [Porticoccaceae bacterium]